MDFLGINTVVNYDMPASRTDYIHRIGRTGRGGRRGTAITLFVEQDAPKLRGIATLIKASGSEVCMLCCLWEACTWYAPGCAVALWPQQPLPSVQHQRQGVLQPARDGRELCQKPWYRCPSGC